MRMLNFQRMAGERMKDKIAEVKFRGRAKNGTLTELEMVIHVRKEAIPIKSVAIKKFFEEEQKIVPVPKLAIGVGRVEWYSLKDHRPPTYVSAALSKELKAKYKLTKEDLELMEQCLFVDDVRILTEEEFDKRKFLWEV